MYSLPNLPAWSPDRAMARHHRCYFGLGQNERRGEERQLQVDERGNGECMIEI